MSEEKPKTRETLIDALIEYDIRSSQVMELIELLLREQTGKLNN